MKQEQKQENNSGKSDEIINDSFDNLKEEEINDESIKALIRIQEALILHRKINLSFDQCINFWHHYSKHSSESWLTVPSEISEEVLLSIESIKGFTYKKWITPSYKDYL